MKKGILIAMIFGGLLFTGKVYAVPAQNALNNENNEAVYVPGDKAAAKYPKGARIYQEKCMVCHQITGMGIPGAFPPLKGSDFLKKSSKKRLISQVINGSNGVLVVNGTKYSTPMPPQVDNATDAVAVVNYILNAWGNNYGLATLNDAKGIKPGKGNHSHMMMNKGMMGGM